MSDVPLQPPELELETLLLATDWSHGAEALHAHAAAIAKLFAAEVVVVTAYDPPGPLRIKRGAPGLDEYRKELKEHARDVAAEVTAAMINWGVKARAVAGEGHPADVILQTAADEGVGLIIVGGGKARASRYLVGSTAERVMRHADVPVYVYR